MSRSAIRGFSSDPEEFDPERFAPGRADKIPPYAYFPFGGGPRICIGGSFATMETILILASVLQKFRVKLAANHPAGRARAVDRDASQGWPARGARAPPGTGARARKLSPAARPITREIICMLPSLDNVVRLERAQFGRARVALGRAFYDYNLMTYAAPNERRRGPAVTSLYGSLLWDSLRWGEVFVTPSVSGVACWLPPETAHPTFIRQAMAGMLALPLRFGIAGFRKLLAYDEMAVKLHHQHAPRPHWYLSAIGVEPEFQGHGIGSAVMQPILARADAAGLDCYLETHRESNVRLYEKHGFAICQRAEVPGHPHPVWAMLRNPR